MAKNQQQPAQSIGSCDIYVVKLRNINSQAVSDAIRTIHSLNVNAQAPSREALEDGAGRRRIPNTALPSPQPPAEPGLFPEDEVNADDSSGDIPPAQGGQDENTRKPRGTGPKIDRNAAISMVPNLDFVQTGKTALKEFFASKSPKSDVDRALVIAYYLQHTIGAASFGPGHILSGFRHLVVDVPVDLPATLRNMKKKVWLNFTTIDNMTVATEGVNRVEHDLPKGKRTAK